MGRVRAKALIQAALDRGGIEVRRRGSGVRRTLPEVLAHLAAAGAAPATVVDVGVAYGTPGLYEGFPAARLLLVEPLEEYIPTLKELRSSRGAEFAVAAAGVRAGTMELQVHPALVCSSTLGARLGDSADVHTRQVPVVRVDELCADRGLPGPYLLKVDVEGAELDVVAGSDGILADTVAVLLEVSLFRFNGANPQMADVVCAMRERGFVPYDLYGGHLRPLDGALAQVDIAFVRDDGPLRARHEYATAAQADALYASWGFTAGGDGASGRGAGSRAPSSSA